MGTTATSTKKIELVKQLLAKAESTTPAEAEALREAAEKIMLRLGIDDAMLAQHDDGPPQQNVKHQIIFSGRYAGAEVDAAMAVITSLGTCYPLYSRDRDWGRVTIYGRERQVERAAILVESLRLQGMAAMADWWRAAKAYYPRDLWTDHERFIARRSFVAAFGRGAAARIYSERRVVATETTGTELALRDERSAAEDFALGQVARVTNGKQLGSDRWAESAGLDAGRRANVGTAGVAPSNAKQVTA